MSLPSLMMETPAHVVNVIRLTYPPDEQSKACLDAKHFGNVITRVGTFASENLPTLGGGLTWNTSQLYTSGILSVLAGLDGDFNNDGLDNFADINALTATFAPRRQRVGLVGQRHFRPARRQIRARSASK